MTAIHGERVVTRLSFTVVSRFRILVTGLSTVHHVEIGVSSARISRPSCVRYCLVVALEDAFQSNYRVSWYWWCQSSAGGGSTCTAVPSTGGLTR